MIVQCDTCKKYFEDEYRSTLCPHVAFLANDGNNNFSINDDAYIGDLHPISQLLRSMKSEYK
jgi:hypothetical protein